jgi:hypothetical protein
MDPAALIPVADSIPVHWGWFEVLLFATFVAHLLFMNAVVGATVITLARILRGAQGDLDHRAACKLPASLALTVNLGIPPLLFLQVLYGQFLYTSAVLMAVWWLSIAGLVMLAYYGLYLHDFRFPKNGRGRPAVLGVSLLLLLATAFILVNHMTMMLDPARWLAYFDKQDGTLLNWGEPMLIPRYLHFMTGAVAVGGLFLALLGRIRERRGDPAGALDAASGMRWFAWASVVQIIVGFVFLLSLRRDVLLDFMGEDALATGVFAASLAGAGMLLYFGFRRKVFPAAAATVATVALMAVNRDMVRVKYLAPYFHVSQTPVAPDYSPLALFLASCLVGGAVVVWLVRVYVRAGKEA